MGSTVHLRPRWLQRPLPYHQLDLDFAQLGVRATKTRTTGEGLMERDRGPCSWVPGTTGGRPCSWKPVDVSVGLCSWDPVTWDGKHYPQAVGQPWPAWGSRVGRLGASRLHILQVV